MKVVENFCRLDLIPHALPAQFHILNLQFALTLERGALSRDGKSVKDSTDTYFRPKNSAYFATYYNVRKTVY